jgi:hypothetical protein
MDQLGCVATWLPNLLAALGTPGTPRIEKLPQQPRHTSPQGLARFGCGNRFGGAFGGWRKPVSSVRVTGLLPRSLEVASLVGHETTRTRCKIAMTRWPAALLVGAMGMTGCSLISPTGTIGWFQVEHSSWQRLDERESCESLSARLPEGPLIVLVPGVQADGDAMMQLVALLAPAKPAAVWIYRWAPMDRRDSISEELARGLSRLLACVPRLDGELLVLAHSAGGIVVGYGASKLVVPERSRSAPALYVITVASPMSGMLARPVDASGISRSHFAFDIATAISVYPRGPSELAVVHLRTQFPSDSVMKPSATHSPNDPLVGIFGARQTDLPPGLTHDGALTYVAMKIGDGTWRGWFDGWEGHHRRD